MIFGVTGGVMEAALRTAADVLSGQNLESVNYNDVRGLSGIKEATVQLGPNKEIELNVAVSHQMRNVRDFLAQIEQGKKSYHFIEISKSSIIPFLTEDEFNTVFSFVHPFRFFSLKVTCPGGCIGGGGQPQSRDPDILSKRMKSVYTLDERMVKRKSHDNEAVKNLYAELLGKPLSHVSHELLHTRYFARPRPAARSLKAPSKLVQLGEESGNTIYVVFGTQSGTAAQAAKDVKMELQQFIGRAKLCPEPDVSLIAGDALPPNSLMKAVTESLATIFVTCTFGEGEFPTTMEGLWDFLSECDQGSFSEKPFRYAVFGLGSSMYAAGDQFNRAARRLDTRLNELGGDRMVPVGLGDDQSSEQYRGELDKWMETLFPKLFGKKKVAASLLDPPEPLFRLSMAPGKHPTRFHPLPPKYHFITLESTKSVVSPGYSRPAAIFTFSLEETGLSYEVGDHLALLPRNPEEVVESILALYGPEIIGRDLFAVETVDVHGDCPFPPVLSAHELLSQYLDLCGRPSRGFLKQMYLFATTLASREKLRGLYERNDNPQSAEEKDDFELYTGKCATEMIQHLFS
jgi:sulfite reductase alpha subunit-like flavoprotein